MIDPGQLLTKIDVARAQLLTALDMLVSDKDPISIQCLACGGGENSLGSVQNLLNSALNPRGGIGIKDLLIGPL